jgi:hypothetical protein
VTQKVTPDLLVNEVLKAPDYIGSDTPNDADFVDVVVSGSLTASPVSKNINMSPTGSGRINMLPGGGMTVAPVGLGTMDNVVIGSTTAQSGAFTALTSSSATTLNGTTIPASKTLLVTTDIGSSVQAYDLDLAAIAGLTGTSGFLKKTGVNSWALDTVISAGTVTDVALTAPTGLTVSGSPITTSGTLAITYTSGYSLPTNASQANWDTAYADRLKWDGGATGLVAATGRTSLELGTLATQNANSVSITGGAISGASGSFTTLSASSTVSGAGFSDYLASPPAIGGSSPAAGAFTTLSSSSTTTVGTNLVFSGTGARITGDFSNATIANRVAFQTSTTDGITVVPAIPKGTGQLSGFAGYNSSDPGNASTFSLLAFTTTDIRLTCGLTGTGIFLPLTFYTGGSERVRISTTGVVTIGSAISLDPTTANSLVVNSSGNVGIGTSSPGARLSVQKNQDALTYFDISNETNGSSAGVIQRFITYLSSGTGTTSADIVKYKTGPWYFANNDGPIQMRAKTNGVELLSGAVVWTTLSDETEKSIIEPIESAVSKVDTLRSVIGRYNTDSPDVRRPFLIAQDVEKVLPEATPRMTDGKLGLDYSGTIPLLVAAIKELHAEIESLKQRIN